MALIEPRTLKGFRDYLPEAQIPREWLIDTAKRVYRSYGFLPIDTPALEYEEILAGKGGEESDKQMYRFEDHGGRRVALRFDLTVPLARFVAQHSNVLGMPFKRYHVASVWRGENTQRGRYREFMQCDFDTIGTESIAADVETGLVIHDLMRSIGVDRFTIRINNRKILTGTLEKMGLSEKTVPILRAIDKSDKIGLDGLRTELRSTVGLSAERTERIVRLLAEREKLSEWMRQPEGSVEKTDWYLAVLEVLPLAGSETGKRGVDELRQLVQGMMAAGVPKERIAVDTSIARGLDYYTGNIFETVLDDLPAIGSVCSGGRYNDLANLYTKERLPGIGASLGLDRLLAALEEMKVVLPTPPKPIFVPYFDEAHFHDYLIFAAALRKAGHSVELYPEPKKLKTQLQYADRRGFRYAIIIGSDEWSQRTARLKDFQTGKDVGCEQAKLIQDFATEVKRLRG